MCQECAKGLETTMSSCGKMNLYEKRVCSLLVYERVTLVGVSDFGPGIY